MAFAPANTIGLTIPGRPATPCAGRPQHYRRPGNQTAQETRTFPNGTTVTFGTDDVVSNFSIGDPFYSQALIVENATTDIIAVRQIHQYDGNLAMAEAGERVRASEQRGFRNLPSSDFQNSSAEYRGNAAKPHMAGHQTDANFQNRMLANDQHLNFSTGAQGGRHGQQHSNQLPGMPSENLHQAPNTFYQQGQNFRVPLNAYGAGQTVQTALNAAAQNRGLPFIADPQSRFVKSTSSGSIPGFNPHQIYNTAVQGSMLPAMRINQPFHPLNTQLASLTSVNYPGHSLHASSQYATARYTSSMLVQRPTLYDTSVPNQAYYGPVIFVSAVHQDSCMAANGINPPATLIPDPRYYHGPLHYLTPHVAQAIVNFVEGSKHPGLLLYKPERGLARMTMLTPFGLPPKCYFPGASQTDIHSVECNRHKELMQEVLAVPGIPELGEETMRWYRIMGEPRTRCEQPVWHPNVIDLYGQASQYEYLLVRDVNHRNGNDLGVGRMNAPGNRYIQAGAAMGFDQRLQKTPTMGHNRQESEETSVFFRDTRTPPNIQSNIQYIGYEIQRNGKESASPKAKPSPPNRGRSADTFNSKTAVNSKRSHSARHGQRRAFSATRTPLSDRGRYSSGRGEEAESSTRKTPLMDFDSRYTAEYGEGEDVDFAIRDAGPPRFGGQTFNQMIGFAPSHERSRGSEAHFGSQVNVPRRYRR